MSETIDAVAMSETIDAVTVTTTLCTGVVNSSNAD